MGSLLKQPDHATGRQWSGRMARWVRVRSLCGGGLAASQAVLGPLLPENLPGLTLLLRILGQARADGISFLVLSGYTGSEFKLWGESKFQVASCMQLL